MTPIEALLNVGLCQQLEAIRLLIPDRLLDQAVLQEVITIPIDHHPQIPDPLHRDPVHLPAGPAVEEVEISFI